MENNTDETIEELKKKNKMLYLLLIFFTILLIVVLICVFFMYYERRKSSRLLVDKPIIYLYPKEETEVSIVAGYPEKFTHTYPKYDGSWNVVAEPNGTLHDKKTGRELYSLYWEGKDEVKVNDKEGFCVKGEDTISFLEDKLAKLGLNEREAEEFIVYWLPILEENKYNFIHFLTTEEVEEIMPLEITPNPDTRIRILMEYKGLNKEIKVEEQKIETPERNGFVMVEWGGAEIK